MLGTVLRQQERSERANEAFAEGLRLYEEKGNRVAATQLRADLAASGRV